MASTAASLNAWSAMPMIEQKQQQADPSSSSSLSSTPTNKLAPEEQVANITSRLFKINTLLRDADPEEIIEWAIDNLPGLYQTTAFGLTGCVTLDQVSKISQRRQADTSTATKHLVPLIFLDTLYHFPQTTDLADRAATHYSAPMHIYRPEGCQSTLDFERIHGTNLWERDEEKYDYLVKVEPARRAYRELGVRAVFTGRRRSQGADRASLSAVEVDETGLIKVNPLLNWSFGQVQAYVKAHNVPYNELLDYGYRSVGDWHSTQPSSSTDASSGAGAVDEGERAGRWAGRAKTECGLHKDYFEMTRSAKAIREAVLARKDEERGDTVVLSTQQEAQALQ